MQNLGKIDRYS